MLSALLFFVSLSAGIGYAGSGQSFPCFWDWQCGGRCVDWFCKDAANGVRCAFDGDCRSNHCGWDLKCAGADLNENDWCDSDKRCKSGFCHKEWKNFGIYDAFEHKPKEGKMGRPEMQISKKALPWDPVCRTKKNDYQHVGIDMGGNSNAAECKSGHATCGWCTPKGKTYTNDVGHWCTKKEHCKWNLLCLPDENNYHVGCRGSCGRKKKDGEFLGIDGNYGKKVVDYKKYCESGRGVCGTCRGSGVQPKGAACGETSDCGPRLYCELLEGSDWMKDDYKRDFCEGVCREQFDANAICVNWKGEDDACKDHQRACKVDPKVKSRRTCQLRVTPEPTTSPTPKPTPAPVTLRPTSEPTSAPTPIPTNVSTEEPSPSPTPAPTDTVISTFDPSAEPSPSPTLAPTDTLSPTVAPTDSSSPADAPAGPGSPADAPTGTPRPTAAPTAEPTPSPTLAPSDGPTAEPTPLVALTMEPTPLVAPIETPRPTSSPSAGPTPLANGAPSGTFRPTLSPTAADPTASPLGAPTDTLPTFAPTEGPTPDSMTSAFVPTSGPTTSEPSKPVASRQEKNGSAKGVFSSQLFIVIFILMCLVIVIVPLLCHYLCIPRMCDGGVKDVKEGAVDVKDGGVILI